jgi:phosphoenolpyruvate-protein kinase (PTS system EI component)
MAGDPANAWALLGLGLRTFSMTAREIPAVRSWLRETALADAQQLARAALLLTCAADVTALALASRVERSALERGP